MTEQELNAIPPRWISITQAMQYAPAYGRKKIITRLKNRDFYGYMDGGEWVIDRFSMDDYFLKERREREAAVATALAKCSGL